MKLEPPLNRRYKLIVFDWDGTAVESRRDTRVSCRGPIRRLLRSGVPVVVVTGTNFANIDRQLSATIRGPFKRDLYIACNRGSEVYGFDAHGRAIPVWLRTATPREDQLMTEIADAVRDEIVRRTKLEVAVIYDRLNRRKVDLIPTERWADPPKSVLAELLLAVEGRLKGAGLEGGLEEAFALTQRIAAERGLGEARITSDVKHIEIGLTDKADSIAWVVRDLAGPHGIRVEDILIGGDEFGPIAGFPGSDSLMITAAAGRATFVSVGPEPAGVPEPVIHLGGGPDRFTDLLAAQARLHPVLMPAEPTADPAWLLVEEGASLTREHEIESLFAIGNGHMGSRGSIAEGTPLSAPATYVAGMFDTPPGGSPGLVTMPDWTHLEVKVDGQPLRMEVGQTLEHRRVLDMYQGIFWREWRQQDDAGRVTRLRGMRLASLADRRLLMQCYSVTPENYSGAVVLEGNLPSPLVFTTTSGTQITCVIARRLEDPEGRVFGPFEAMVERSLPFPLDVELNHTYRIDRLFTLHTSRDSARPLEASLAHLDEVIDEGISPLVAAHRREWEERWRACDVVIDGDPAAQRALRFAIYHMVSAVNPEDERVSIGARALTGPAYKGHVFWDTELYMLPFFTLTFPKAARALLMYRYHTLPGARAKAARGGYRGAMYAWESADTGEEVTPQVVVGPEGELVRVLAGDQEQHITADIAYAVWSYWDATQDERFLVEAGAEILLETARFWASRAQLEEDGLYHIRGIIGPDEYHEGVDDNAFTNVMAQHNLELGERVARLLAERWPERWRELTRAIRLGPREPANWLDVARRMYTGFDESTGLYEQFQGYFGLEDIDLSEYEPRTAPMDVLLGRERTQRSKVIKQSDVVMLIYLFWDRLPPEVREVNFRYYAPRCGHGSSLSPAIHALVAARLGDMELAELYFDRAAHIDLADNMGNAAGGVHAAALGGLWQAATFGFAGLSLDGDGATLRPNLPARWERVRFNVQWRGRRFAVDLSGAAARQERSIREEYP